jgi:hypothetical protein
MRGVAVRELTAEPALASARIPGDVLVSVAGSPARPLVPWMRWFLDVGFQWTSQDRDVPGRRVTVLSMPADSPAAGMVALGALVGEMSRPDANEIHAHFQSLLRNAQQYLHHCRDCGTSCRPENVGCGFLSRATEKIRSAKGSGIFEIHNVGIDAARGPFIHVQTRRGGATCLLSLFEASAPNYQVPGEPPYLVGTVAGSLSREPYAAIFPQASILAPNLASSHAGVCLAGRPAGMHATRAGLDAVRFHVGGRAIALSELLSISDWAPRNTVSRMTYFSTGRICRMDRRAPSPALVVADGDASLLEVLSRSEFRSSNVIGIVHRCSERAAQEELWQRLDDLQQWYSAQPVQACLDQEPPRGCTGVVLCQEV